MLDNKNQRIAAAVVTGLVVVGGIGIALLSGDDDAAPDLDVLCTGIERGIADLLAAARRRSDLVRRSEERAAQRVAEQVEPQHGG